MDVLMPQLGETVAEGKITQWFKSAGDSVKPGDNLFEIETDKVSMEVPSTTAGVLAEIRVRAGAVARRQDCDAAGAPARGGRRHRSRKNFALRSVRPHSCPRCGGRGTRHGSAGPCRRARRGRER